MKNEKRMRLAMMIFLILLCLSIGTLFVISLVMETQMNEEENKSTSESVQMIPPSDIGNGISDVVYNSYSDALETVETEIVEVEERMEKVEYSDDIKLLAQLVIAEAENQPLTGQLLVADVVMNRVDNENFPNTIQEVIFQHGQFTCVDNGRFAACADKVTDEWCDLIYNEMYQRQSYNVLYFRTGDYFNFGTPASQIGDHFFSEE